MCKKVILNAPFDSLWQDKDVFAEVFAMEGEVFRHVKSRRTFRIEVGGKGFFVKVHRGIGWREIFKNLLQFKVPVTGARNEYEALQYLAAINVPTMEAAAFGERFADPAAKESFLITRELENIISLEDLGKEQVDPVLRLKLIRQVALSAGKMHRAGINHRDCYICHYVLDKNSIRDKEPVVSVIDLHRAQKRSKVPWRYLVKDVAGLEFSAWSAALTRREALRFVRWYSGRHLKDELKNNGRFWQQVEYTAARLYCKENKLPFNGFIPFETNSK